MFRNTQLNYSMNYISRIHGAASTTIVYIATSDISAHKLFKEELTELSAILDSFSLIPQVLTYIRMVGWGGREPW